MIKLTEVRITIGKIRKNFFSLGKVSNSSSLSTSLLGSSFQKTSTHILVIKNKVIKLAKIKAMIKKYDSAVHAAWNKLIFGQNPDNGEIPTKENKTIAKSMES